MPGKILSDAVFYAGKNNLGLVESAFYVKHAGHYPESYFSQSLGLTSDQ